MPDDVVTKLRADNARLEAAMQEATVEWNRADAEIARLRKDTVAQMAATIASGLVRGRCGDGKSIAAASVSLARAIVAEVERAETEEQEHE